MTREERTRLAEDIAKKLEDATKDEKSPDSEQVAILGLVTTFLWPYELEALAKRVSGAARLIWQALNDR